MDSGSSNKVAAPDSFMSRSLALFDSGAHGLLRSDRPKRAGLMPLSIFRCCFAVHFLGALSSVLMIVASSASAQTTFTSGFWSYTVGTNGAAAIVDYNGPGGHVDIPGQIDGYAVKRLGRTNSLRAFLSSASSTVVGINIPHGVEVISAYAFNRLTNLVSIALPSSVKFIGFKAFQSCSNLTNVTLQPGVGIIGAGAFMGCAKLTEVRIPNTVLDIGSLAFEETVELLPDATALAAQEPFTRALAGNEQFIGMLAEKIKSEPGPAGPKGDRGPAGPPGPRGPQGSPGRIWPFR